MEEKVRPKAHFMFLCSLNQDEGAEVAAVFASVEVQGDAEQEPEALTPPPAEEPWKTFLPLDEAAPAA